MLIHGTAVLFSNLCFLNGPETGSVSFHRMIHFVRADGFDARHEVVIRDASVTTDVGVKQHFFGNLSSQHNSQLAVHLARRALQIADRFAFVEVMAKFISSDSNTVKLSLRDFPASQLVTRVRSTVQL